jgi:hypothetical protein
MIFIALSKFMFPDTYFPCQRRMRLQSHYMTTRKLSSLRTAADNEGTPDKEATSYPDIFDAFRLALKFYHFEETSS